MRTSTTLVRCGSVLMVSSAASAAVVGYEDFDGGAINLSSTTNVFDFNAGGGTGGDAFGRVSQWAGGAGTGGPFDVWDDSVADTSGGGVFATDNLAIAGMNTSAFFALNDSDGITPAINNAVWTFNIGGATITDIMIDLAAMGDFELASQDGFLIEAQVDGGGYAEIFRGITDEAGSHTYRAFDDGDTFLLSDPLALSIDGVPTGTYLDKSDAATGAFDSFTSLLLAGVFGNTVDIRVSWAGAPSGSEPMGIDNITINAVPAPGAIALLGLAGVVGGRRRRG